MTYACIDDVSVGDVLMADGGFTCVDAGKVTIEAEPNGDLFFRCNAGKHFIDGQIDDEDGLLVGLSHESKEEA